jgi:cytochrome P450
MTATEDHDMHRKRRGVINPFFSVASVRKLEPVIREHTEKVLNRIEHASGPIEMNVLFKAYASDTVVQYAFGDCFHFLDDAQCGKPYFKAVDMFFSLNHLFGHWPIVGWMVAKTPGWIMRNFGEGLREMWEKKMVCLTRGGNKGLIELMCLLSGGSRRSKKLGPQTIPNGSRAQSLAAC